MDRDKGTRSVATVGHATYRIHIHPNSVCATRKNKCNERGKCCQNETAGMWFGPVCTTTQTDKGDKDEDYYCKHTAPIFSVWRDSMWAKNILECVYS